MFTSTHLRTWLWGVAALSATSLLSGCVGLVAATPTRPHYVIATIDATLPSDQRALAVAACKLVVAHLGARDRFQVNVIANQSGRDKDVLLPVRVMPQNGIALRRDRRALQDDLDRLAFPAVNNTGTDLLTAMADAATEFERNPQRAECQDVLVVPSDLRPDGHDIAHELAQRPIHFRAGTRVLCLLVPNSTAGDADRNPVDVWQELVGNWTRWFGEMGVTLRATDLLRPQESTGSTLEARLRELLGHA